jgi:hypothetical protein
MSAAVYSPIFNLVASELGADAEIPSQERPWDVESSTGILVSVYAPGGSCVRISTQLENLRGALEWLGAPSH